MKSGGPWNLRGLHPEARAAAREAARRSGMSVGEWFNTVIQPTDDDEQWWAADVDREPEDQRPPGFNHDNEERDRHRGSSWRQRSREPDDRWQPNVHDDARERDHCDPNWRRDREPDHRRPRKFNDDRGRQRHRDTNWSRRDHDAETEWRRSFREVDPGYGRPPAAQPRRPRREPDDQFRRTLHDDDREQGQPPAAQVRRRRREPDDQFRPTLHDDDREQGRYAEANQHRRERSKHDQTSAPEGRPYRENRHRQPAPYRPEPERAVRPPPREPERYEERLVREPTENDHDASIDRAIAEIEARQRALDRDVSAEIKPQPRASAGDAVAEITAPPRAPAGDVAAEVTARPRMSDGDAEAAIKATPHGPAVDVAAEIKARQRELDGGVTAEAKPSPVPLDDDIAAEITVPARLPDDAPPERSFGDREPLPLSSRPQESQSPPKQSLHSGAAPLDLSGLEQQLREITTRIEALRPAGDLEAAINGLRAGLAEIGRSLTEALPRRALESLEIEVKALGQRIDHSRQSGVNSTALAGVERGLAEVREALRGLTPAESLVGFREAVDTLAKRVDAIVAKDDPAALQQLETAIGALRGIVSHVASNDTLTKVAEDVRALAAKVDGLASSAANPPSFSALENRIDTLAAALNASAEAGHAVPRELERLLSGLIEKLEWVQLTHTDHTALAHLEDRIATLVKRLDASDARLGLLEGVERGLADLLVYIEQLPGKNGAEQGGIKKPVAGAFEQEVAEIKQTERRTQESLEAVQGTVEHVVDRLAMIESGMRVDRTKPALAEPVPANAQKPASGPPPIAAKSAAIPLEPGAAAALTPIKPEPAPQRSVAARTPIDPNLPPDHPLEPGYAPGRSRQPPSAADRIAASEATLGSKPPIIPDPGGGKPDFIAAARRAAQAAASASPQAKSSPGSASVAPAKTLTERLRKLVVAAAVVGIVVGGFHIISRLFADGGSSAPSQVQTEPPRAEPELPNVQSQPPRAQPDTPPEHTMPPHAQAEPQVQTQALPLPAAQPPAGPAAIIPVPPPSVNSTQNRGTPSATVSPATGVGPAQQSSGKQTTVPSATSSGPSPVGPKAPMDITGALGPSLPHEPAAARASRSSDKLPAAIGGPALRAAALAGDPSAAYEVAVRFAEGRVVPPNNEEAARWFDRAAKKGLAPAQFRLGALYEKGVGVKKDLAAARDLYRAAADKGHGKAMHNLAVLYSEGINGAADYRSAAEWFHRAAERGVADSQFNLAVLYARGVGVEQNFEEAYKWFSLAAQEGDRDAARKRDEVASHLDEEALTAARLAAQTFKPLPQPADAVTVKGAWDPPATAAPPAKAKPRSAKAAAPETAKVN